MQGILPFDHYYSRSGWVVKGIALSNMENNNLLLNGDSFIYLKDLNMNMVGFLCPLHVMHYILCLIYNLVNWFLTKI